MTSHAFSLDSGLLILERTPAVLRVQLSGLSDEWLRATEGGETWSPYDVVGHLAHLERTDWMVRVRRVMAGGEERKFDPVDRVAMLRDGRDRPIDELLDEFEMLRTRNLADLGELNLREEDLVREGLHPSLGPVTLRNLLATWVAHDLGHLVQVGRVMARRYRDDVGPWAQYLSVMG